MMACAALLTTLAILLVSTVCLVGVLFAIAMIARG